jgi:hypothetical protein
MPVVGRSRQVDDRGLAQRTGETALRSTRFDSPLRAPQRATEILAVALMAAIGQSAYAEDLGQWAGYQLSVEQKAWFKRLHDANGIGCCDSADGYPVDYEMRKDGYYVHFNSVWLSVTCGYQAGRMT